MSDRDRITVRALREDRGRFAALRSARVLVYWPHGLGDWVHFASIAPLLEPSNVYAITRFGDDYVSTMEGNRYVRPIFSGVRTPNDGSREGTRHFGIELRRCNGARVHLALSAPLRAPVESFAPDILLWTDYPETEGRTAYPFHTKARNLARLLVARDRLSSLDLSRPLRSTIDFEAPAAVQRLVDERLARFIEPADRLCIISRTGVTAARKNWGDHVQAQELVQRLRRQDSRWRALTMDGETLGDGAADFRDLFGDLNEPFARLYKALLARTSLFIGIPAGPLHMAMARTGVPTIGLWLAHHPDWYDEPNPDAVHLIGRYVRERRFDRRPATTTKPPSLFHRICYLDTAEIPGELVLEAVRAIT